MGGGLLVARRWAALRLAPTYAWHQPAPGTSLRIAGAVGWRRGTRPNTGGERSPHPSRTPITPLGRAALGANLRLAPTCACYQPADRECCRLAPRHEAQHRRRAKPTPITHIHHARPSPRWAALRLAPTYAWHQPASRGRCRLAPRHEAQHRRRTKPTPITHIHHARPSPRWAALRLAPTYAWHQPAPGTSLRIAGAAGWRRGTRPNTGGVGKVAMSSGCRTTCRPSMMKPGFIRLGYTGTSLVWRTNGTTTQRPCASCTLDCTTTANGIAARLETPPS